MSLSILPSTEKWDCHGCGVCCRGTTVPLDNEDLRKIREQGWDETPEFKNKKTVVRSVAMGGRMVLAQHANGDCVFLNEKGRCRIHEKFGGNAKPAICRMFPFQLVPTAKSARLTVKRSCPSAANEVGKPLAQHTKQLKSSGLLKQFKRVSPEQPPPITPGEWRSWEDFEATTEAISRIINDETLPMVRRIVHAVQFCDLLSECKLQQVAAEELDELIEVLEHSCSKDAGDKFRDIQSPSVAAKSNLRQLGAHFLRSHPMATGKETIADRIRTAWLSLKFARGKGTVPTLAEEFPTTTFHAMDRALGPLKADVAEPLNRYFATQAMTRQYAFVDPHRSLVESFRCLAMTYPIALWMARLVATGREPARQDLVDIVVAIERGQGISSLTRTVRATSNSRQLPRLVVWYAR